MKLTGSDAPCAVGMFTAATGLLHRSLAGAWHGGCMGCKAGAEQLLVVVCV